MNGFLGRVYIDNMLSQNSYIKTLEASLIHLGKKESFKAG